MLVFSDGLITCTLFDGVVRHCSSCSRRGWLWISWEEEVPRKYEMS